MEASSKINTSSSQSSRGIYKRPKVDDSIHSGSSSVLKKVTFRFNQGYSNAVRRPVNIIDFL